MLSSNIWDMGREQRGASLPSRTTGIMYSNSTRQSAAAGPDILAFINKCQYMHAAPRNELQVGSRLECLRRLVGLLQGCLYCDGRPIAIAYAQFNLIEEDLHFIDHHQ
jgi:hypothetical protein